MSFSAKPHSGDPVLVHEQTSFGEMVYRFTDAWYNYFDSIDRDITVNVTQSVNNTSITGAASLSASVEYEVADLQRSFRSLTGEVRHGQCEAIPRSEIVAMIEQAVCRQSFEQAKHNQPFGPHEHTPDDVIGLSRRVSVPADDTSPGRSGDWAADDSFFYFCYAKDSWGRTPLSGFPGSI